MLLSQRALGTHAIVKAKYTQALPVSCVSRKIALLDQRARHTRSGLPLLLLRGGDPASPSPTAILARELERRQQAAASKERAFR